MLLCTGGFSSELTALLLVNGGVVFVYVAIILSIVVDGGVGVIAQ